MVFVNGEQPIIILEFGEELLSNNSNICVIQSNRKWDLAAISNLEEQITQGEQVLYLHGGTSDVQTLTEDKSAQREPTNDSRGLIKCFDCKYDNLCDKDKPCVYCNGHNYWEPKED